MSGGCLVNRTLLCPVGLLTMDMDRSGKVRSGHVRSGQAK